VFAVPSGLSFDPDALRAAQATQFRTILAEKRFSLTVVAFMLAA
jgi:hypothetical protein